MSLLVPVLAYGSETIIWREKERSRIWGVQMNNLRGLLGIRRLDKVPDARIRQLCGVTKGVDKKRCSPMVGPYREMENDRIAIRVLCRRVCR